MTKRLFVAIDLPESTRQLLASLDPQIRGVRWIEATQMHLTLAFFGDVADDTELALREKFSLPAVVVSHRSRLHLLRGLAYLRMRFSQISRAT